MSTTNVDAPDTTIHQTNIWLKEAMEELNTPYRHQAYLVLRAVFKVISKHVVIVR